MGFGAIIFKQPYFENGDQTRFFKILDTSVQCLNTEHCVLKRVTKRALNLLGNPSLEIGFDKNFEKFFVKHFFREF